MIPLIIAAVTDIRKKDISVAIPILCGVLSLIFAVIPAFLSADPYRIKGFFFSLIPGVLMLLISGVTDQSLGYGDGLMALAIGPAFGLEGTVFALTLAVFASGLFSIVLLVIRKAGKKTQIPFLPFMTLGMGVMLFAPV